MDGQILERTSIKVIQVQGLQTELDQGQLFVIDATCFLLVFRKIFKIFTPNRNRFFSDNFPSHLQQSNPWSFEFDIQYLPVFI